MQVEAHNITHIFKLLPLFGSMASSVKCAGYKRTGVSVMLQVLALFFVALFSPLVVAETSLGRRAASQALQRDLVLGRRLLDAAAPAATTPTVVNTFEELNQAVIDGVADVEIRSHIDARTAATTLPQLLKTRSIRVRIPIRLILNTIVYSS